MNYKIVINFKVEYGIGSIEIELKNFEVLKDIEKATKKLEVATHKQLAGFEFEFELESIDWKVEVE